MGIGYSPKYIYYELLVELYIYIYDCSCLIVVFLNVIKFSAFHSLPAANELLSLIFIK